MSPFNQHPVDIVVDIPGTLCTLGCYHSCSFYQYPLCLWESCCHISMNCNFHAAFLWLSCMQPALDNDSIVDGMQDSNMWGCTPICEPPAACPAAMQTPSWVTTTTPCHSMQPRSASCANSELKCKLKLSCGYITTSCES